MLRVYYLKQAQAETVTQIIAQMMDGKDLRVAMNTRTNSIVVLASAELHKSLETIVQQLDGTPDPGLEVKIFQLQYIKPTDSLLKILTAAANDTKGPKITLGLDTPANRIIARGPRHSLAMLEAMLRHIDTRSARTEHHFNRQSFLVRIAWLSNSKSFATKKGSYPTDFLPVLKEIQRTGVTAPTMISQLFITTAVNQDFTVSGKTKSQDGLVQVQVSGELLMGTKTDDKGKQKTYSTPLLRVQVKTTRGKKDGKGDDDVDLKTTILAPIGSYSVLGLSPGTDGSNLFVIRIDPK